jgi:hypothetical protein
MRTITRNPFEVEVKFTEYDIALFRKKAQQRQAPKDANLRLVSDKRIINRDNIETHFIGLLGEFALARLIHGNVDTNAYLSGDIEKDFCIYGVTVEVKTLQGYLAFKDQNDFRADVAALVIYNKNDYSSVWVQGWISRKDFMEQCFVDNFGYGERPCLQPAQLLPIETLKTYCLVTRNQRWLLNQVESIRKAVA